MVLISHIYKFIYLKNYKVAGSSVESFFGQYCIDPNEIPNYKFKDETDEYISSYGIIGNRIINNTKTKIWYNHINAIDIKQNIGDSVFNEYFKFCVVRNPYDVVVSSFFFEKSKKDFKTYCKEYAYSDVNLNRLFIDNIPVCQYYIRYENLIPDILTILKKLGISNFNINDLPNHKNKMRPTDKSYKEYYDDEIKEIVYKLFKTEIDMFGYKF
jgi:hypothetical protein